MSYQRERDEFIARAAKAGLSDAQIAGVLRLASTLQRLAVAECNGDWPADNGERPVKPCPECGSFWVPATVKKTGCPDCRATASLTRLIADSTLVAEVSGDPRGYVVHLYPAGTPHEDIDSGRVRGIGVPARER